MKAKWIIENFTDSDDYKGLVKAVGDMRRECFVIGRNNHFEFDPKGYKEGDCIVCQGSIQMTKNIKSKLPSNCFPIAYNSWDNFLCTNYYPHYPDLLFNDKNEFVTVGELKKRRYDFYKKFGKEAVIFLRPDSGEKTFQAQLLDLQDFDRFWHNALVYNREDENELVMVSTPKMINGEWRFVCSKYDQLGLESGMSSHRGHIISSSLYNYQGQRTIIPATPPKAIEFCQKVLDVGYFPDSVFCVDVCEDADGNFWLLELTSFSSAGLYATDKLKVVQAVTAIAEYEWFVKNLKERKKIQS